MHFTGCRCMLVLPSNRNREKIECPWRNSSKKLAEAISMRNFEAERRQDEDDTYPRLSAVYGLSWLLDGPGKEVLHANDTGGRPAANGTS